MKIIVIKGKSNCGKTAALHLVYEKIILVNGGKGTDFKHVGAVNQRDFSDVLPYKGKKIAFFTMGDFEKDLMDAIKKYTAEHCDILVCACNDEHFGIFNQMNKDAYQSVEKTICSGSMPAFEANLYDCYRILEIIAHEISDGA
jgi:hypothetical protein